MTYAPQEALHGPALEALHHLLHLQELLHQAIDVLDLDPRPAGDAAAPGAVNEPRGPPLPQRHGIDDGQLPPYLPVRIGRRYGPAGHLRRQFVPHRPPPPPAPDPLELRAPG